MKSLFGKIKSPVNLANDVNKESLSNIAYSSTHGHLEELQGKLLTASTGTEYASILELFSDQFISAFTGHSSSSNGILEEVIGHPTLLIQHMTEKFLSFIMVDAAGETASSAAPLSSYLSLSSKNTGHSKLEGSVLLHVPALAYVDGLTAASESMGTLLRVTHILAVLCKWQHNREVVIAKCSTGSNTLATACISGLWSMLDSIDGLISAWYGLGDDAANQVSQLYLHCNAVMTFGLASMLILIRMCGTGDAVPLCGLLPTVPWDAQDMLRCGLDLFAGRSSSSSTSSPSSMNLARAASSPPTSPKARVNNSRLVSPLMDRAMDKVHADVLQLMVTTTLKLDRLSTVSEAAWRGGGAAMSTHDHCYHDQQVQRRQCSTLQLSLQVHALYAVHSCLTASPVTVKVFNAADGPVALGSMLALPSPMDQDDRSIDSVHVELIVQRMCSALRCQESILDATFALTKSVSNSCSMQLEESIHCLRPVLLWLCHRADEEGVQHSLDFSEEVLAGMYVECKSPQILQTTLPPTDLFPWHNATGPPSSNATTTSSSSTSSFLSGMINGAFRESSCYSLTNVFKAYWLERCHNDPSSSSCVLPFEPSKTVLYSLVGDSDAASGRTFRLPKDSSRPGAAFFAEYFKDLPTGRMVDCVLSLLYSLSWKYSEKAYSLQDPMVFFKASLRVMVQVLDLLHQGQTTTTRSSSGSSSSIHASSGHQMFLMHTIFFLSRCTKYNPQKTIQTCRALKLWRALLVYSRISQSRAAVAQSPSLNQFLSVVSFDNLSTSDDDDYNGKVPLDAPAYHLIWSYSLSSDDRSESPVTTMTPMALTPIRSTIDYLSAASVSAHELDTSLLTYGGDEESELFRSRTHSLNDPTALFGSLAPFSSHSHFPPSQHHDSTDHPHHHFSNLDSMVNDDASYSTIELPLDVSGISLSGVADDQQAYKHISDDAKGTMHSYKQEYLQFLVRFVVKDMVMELLRICSHFSYLVHALVDTTFDNSLSLDFEAVELVEILSSGSSDESMIVVIRWLNDLADFHNHLSIHSHLWTSAAKKCLGLSKSLLDSLNDFASSIANDSGMILESRPLFWSVRAAAIQLIGKIVYSTCSKDWIDTFIPNIDSALSANSSLVQRPVRHTVIIRLILDPLCRDFAIAIIIKVLQRCAEILFGLPKHAVQSSSSSSSSKMISQQTMLEALAHDIIKCLLNTLINAPSQPKSNDSSGAVIMSLHALIVLLRNPSALTWNKDSRVSSSAATIYQGLFTNYGPMTPNHSIFGWTYSRYNIFRDLLASLNATFKKSSSTWDAGRKTSVLNYSLALMCALLADNDTHKEVFRSLMMQRTKRKSSNVAAASSSPSSNTYHDLISMMVTCCDGSTVTDETICIIIEMLLDGFSVEVRRQLAGGVFFPGFDPIPRMRNLIAVPLLLNIAYFCSPEMQCYVIDLLYLLIGGSGSNSLINLSKSLQLQQPSLFELLLDVFPVLSVPAQASAVKILKLLGRNTVNVAQLKRLFRLLHLKDGERPAYSWNLLDAMEGMIVPSTVPRYYFFFQGNDSGLRLPGFKKWPATKGFSFSTWFCVDNPLVVVSSYSSSSSSSSSHSKGREAAAATATTPKYRPTLLCFRQESGVGIELSLSPMVVDKEDSFLIKYSVFSTNNAVASVDVGIVSKSKLNAEGWHHLAFSHSASSFRAKSELTVVLDNKPAEHHFISFPRFTDEIKAPTIGDVAPSFRDEATKMMMMTGFFGQVATIYFFSDPLQAAYLHGIYELGPAYSQLFIDKDVNQQQHGYDSSTTAPADNRPISSSYKVHDGYLSSTIMLTYNAGVRKGNMIIDNTPEKNNNLWRQNRGADAVDPSADERDQDLQVAAAAAAAAAVESDNRRRMQAYCLKGTHICSTRDIRDSFDCLGGVKILLPLFNQLLSGSSASADESALSEHQQLYCKIVRLYFCFLRPTLENYRTINMFGFGLLADFMDTLGPRFLSLDLLTELTSRCDSLSWNESWQNSCVSEILCNFKLWSFSGFEVQRALCDYLHAFADRSVDRFHKVVKVSLFFDALAIFYSSSSLSQDGPSSSSSAAAAARGILSKRQSTGLNKFKPGGEYWMVSPDWKRFHSLDAGQLDAIRGRITGIIFFVMTSTSDSIEDDVDKMIKFILMEPNPSHKVSMLKTLIAMLNTDRDEIGNKILVTLSMRSSSASFFIQLAAEAEPKVRLYSLIGLCSMVRLALQHGKVSGVPVAWVDSMRGAGATASAASDYSKQDDASIGTTEGTETSSSAFPSFAMTRAGSSKFNFAHKSDHSMSSFNHHAEHDANNDPTSNDVFEALGIPGAQLVSSFQHILNRFKENINKNSSSSSSSSRDVFDQRQFYVIFTALSLCMFGSPNNSLLGHAERLFEKEGDNDNDDDDDTRSQLTVGELLEMERGLEYEFAAEFDFQDSRICVPMILPSLIALLQVDSMRSTVRVRLLMRLRSFFHSFENCDIFLTTPLWQSYVLNAIAMEQNRVLFLKEHLNKTREDLLGELHREIDEANNIVDIWTRLMCDLHLHCVQFGSPGVSSFALAKPRRSRMHDYYSLSTKDLLDIIRKDSRKLGCAVLRESLGILRTFSSNGILDDGKTIGVDLLSRTVEVIQREYNAVTTIAATMMMMQSPSELATRRKLLELNIWLVTFFALDFIVVPPAEISDRSSVKNIILSSILHSSDTTMFNAPNTPTFYKQLVATVPTHKQSPNPGKEPLMLDESIIPPSRTVSFSVDMLHEDYAAEETSDEVFGVEPGGTSDRFGVQTSSSSSSSSSTRKGRTRKLFLSSTLSSSSDDYHHHRRGPTAQEERPPTVSDLSSAGASNDQISPLRPIESCLPTASFSPDISRIDSSSSSQQQQQHYDYPLQNTTSLTVQEISVEEERYNAKVWKLVASLLTLLGPAGSSSWQALDRVDRLLKATVKAGYRQGRLLVTYITQESAEALLQQQQPAVVSMPPLTPLKVQSLSMSSALNRSVDGTFWIVLRVLLDVFIKSDSPTASTSAGDAMNDAGCKLIEMLEWLKEISKEFYDNECVYIAIKLIKAMRVSALRGVMMGGGGGEGSSAWSKAASKLTVKLLTDQRTKILGRIEDLVQGCSPSDLEELFNTAATGGGGGGGGGGVTAVKSSVLSPRLYDRSDIDSFDDADYSSPYLSQSAVQELNLILDLINHCVAPPSTTQQQITWSVWDRVTEPIFIEASQAERDLVKSKLTDDFGSERDIEDSRKQLVEARRIEQKQSYMILSRLEELMSRVKAAEHGRLKDIAKAEDVKRRKCRSDWAAVYEELANERGAWGAALESAESLWVVDHCEDNYRMKRKLSRSPHGVEYLPTFLKKSIEAHEQSLQQKIRSLSASSAKSDSSDEQQQQQQQQQQVAHKSSTAAVSSSSSSSSSADIHSESELSRNPNIVREVLKFTNSDKNNNNNNVNDSHKDDDSDDEDDDMVHLSAEEDDRVVVGKQKRIASDLSSNNSIVATNLSMMMMDPSQAQDRVLFSAICQVITAACNSTNEPMLGVVEITKARITYTRGVSGQVENFSAYRHRPKKPENSVSKALWACAPFPNTQWSTAEICNVSHRYYQLRFVAIEMFTTSRKSVFFNLFDRKKATKFQMILRHVVKPPHMSPYFGKSPATIVTRITAPGSQLNLTAAWTNREISNFDYLMRINTIAGRTYNDLGQYPIFPWIIANYHSSELNLKDPNTYRDLRWPMGAQDIKQREMIAAKYADLKCAHDEMKSCGGTDDCTMMPPFHYGTHYSVAGFVLWYLMRVEPYTSLHVQLQDGRIDRPDRLFHSLEAAYKGCISNPSDVKELVPEMFSNPDILQNVNLINFGVTQTNTQLGDIVLPNWAKDPDDFIFKHREAFESEYVSLHLHHWIDLIFGYKQRPPHLGGDEAAVTSCNVYYHLTYEKAVDLEALKASNPELYQQYVCQISEFGQMPCQLFKKPHPARQPLHKVDIIWPVVSVINGINSLSEYEKEKTPKPRKIICFKEFNVSVWPVVFIGESADRLITVDSTRVCGCHTWQVLSPDVVPPFRLKIDQIALQVAKGQSYSLNSLFAGSNANKEKRIGVPFAPFQAPLPSASKSAIHASATTAAETLPIDGTNNKWRPTKFRAYEKEESARSQQQQQAKKRPPAAPAIEPMGSNLSTPNRTRARKVLKGMVPKAGDEEMLSNTSSPIMPVRQLTSKSSGTTRRQQEDESRLSKASNAAPIPAQDSARTTFNVGSSFRVLDQHISAQQFAYLPESKLIFTCGHWDHSCRVTAVESGHLIQSLRQHRDVITCLAVAKDFGQRWLITGSRDCTLMVWEITADKEGAMPLSSHPLHILYGHDDAVTCVDISPEMDLVVSGSDDGTIILHNLRDGAYIRSILDTSKTYHTVARALATMSQDDMISIGSSKYSRAVSGGSTGGTSTAAAAAVSTQLGKISWLCVSKEAYIIAYSDDDKTLCTFSLNGHAIAVREVPESLYALMLSEDGKVLITGGSSCLVVFRWVRTLELANDGPRQGFEAVLDGSMEEHNIPAMSHPIRSLHMTRLERHLIAGLESGEMRILAQDPNYLRQRLQNKLIEIGIL